MPHSDALKIYSCGKHCEKRRNCLSSGNGLNILYPWKFIYHITICRQQSTALFINPHLENFMAKEETAYKKCSLITYNIPYPITKSKTHTNKKRLQTKDTVCLNPFLNKPPYFSMSPGQVL